MQRALRDRSLCEIWAQESDKPPVFSSPKRAQTTGLSPRTLNDDTTSDRLQVAIQANPRQANPRHANPIEMNRIHGESDKRQLELCRGAAAKLQRRIWIRIRVRNLTDDRD